MFAVGTGWSAGDILWFTTRCLLLHAQMDQSLRQLFAISGIDWRVVLVMEDSFGFFDRFFRTGPLVSLPPPAPPVLCW